MPPMKRFILFLAVSLGAAAVSAQAPSGLLLDSYAAIVNGKVITVGDILALLQPARERLASRHEGEELKQKLQEEYNSARDALIESQLILLDFEMQGGVLPDRAVEDHINGVIHDRFGNDRTAFLAALAAERLTFAEWRKQMKDQFIVSLMRQKEVSAKILISPLDLQNAYEKDRDAFALPERVSLRTLALDNGDTAKEQKKALKDAAKLRARILSGETTFEAESGGAAEWFEIGSLDETLRAAIAGLEPGALSEPLEIGGELYLVQLVERQAARVAALDEVAPEIEKKLRRAEFDRLDRIWIDTLRSKYFIQIFSHNLFD